MRLSILCTAAFFGCTPTSPLDTDIDEKPTLAPPPEGEGFQLAMDGVAPALSETWLCSVYPIPNTALSNVNFVEYEQNYGTHHMTISTMGFVGGQIAPGTYDCNELYGDTSVMENQIMIFGGAGDEQGTMQLPEGVVAQLPTGIDIIHEVHYVNASQEDVQLHSRVNAWTIPESEVVSGIWGGQVRDEIIDIPPQAEHTDWTRCVMNEDVDVIFLASHMHARGIEFTIKLFDGSATGEMVYTNDDWHDPKIVQFEDPIHVPAGSGFEYSCTWNNESDASVSYGLRAEDEMCNMTYVHTPMSMTAACEVVATSDDAP